MTEAIVFSLNPQLDATALAHRYAQAGRVQIADFLAAECAAALHRRLRQRDDWVQVVNSAEKVFDLSRAQRQAMDAEQRRALDDAVYAGARHGFQFRYEAIRIPDDPEPRASSVDPLARLATFLSEGPCRELLRVITGEDGIDFADLQATAFSPGDFLTAHDDGVPGKNRLAAYVLGLTPAWRTEWGGLLLFHDSDRVHEGYVPRLNTLNLFRVPQPHSVSEVSRAAAYRRYSITGWLRSR